MSKYGIDATIKSLSGVVFGDLNLVNDAALDALISSLNTQFSAMVDKYCNRDFNLYEAASITIRGTYSRVLQLTNGPIIGIDSITKDDTTLIDSDDYFIRPVRNSQLLSDSVELLRDYFFKEIMYTVVYDHGFATPPDDIVKVVNDLAIMELQSTKDKQKSGNAKSISMGGFSVSYGDSETTQANILSSINNWRMVIF